MQNANQIFQQAVAAHQRGDFQTALSLYQRVLAVQPGHPLVLTYLGICEHALGQTAVALARLDTALRATPNFADAHLHRGEMLRSLGRAAEAEAAYRRAVALKPGLAAAWIGLGIALYDQQRFGAAIEAYGTAMTHDPQSAMPWLNQANAWLALGDSGQALHCCDEALQRAPDLQPAHLTRARALIEHRRLDEALAVLSPLAVAQPHGREVQLTLAQALDASGRRDEAIARYEALLAQDPHDADALNGLGVVLEVVRRWDEAMARYDAALALRPQQADLWVNRGRLQGRMKRWAAADADLQRALALRPAQPEAWVERGQLAYEVEDWAQAEQAWRHALAIEPPRPDLVIGTRLANLHARVCDWREIEADTAAFVAGIAGGHGRVNPFAVLNWLDDALAQYRAARAWTAHMYPTATAIRQPLAARRPGRIRIAYVSGDFHDHATMYLAARMFELHDRERFEIWGVSIGPAADDVMRARAVAAFEHFWDAREASDDAIVQQLRAWDIDIAVDLKGYTKDNRTGVFAQRAAPIQVSYLGYPGTMGADFMDYIVADATVVPREHFEAYTERVVWLPDCYQVNDDTRPRPTDGPTRAAVGLPEDAVVLCCFNNAHKLKPALFDVWMRVLVAAPSAVLWLWADDDVVRERLQREAHARGVDPTRLHFARALPHHEHLARLRLADLFVDTLPYNAHTTASDALWAGVPVVTLMGQAFASRVAASVLRAADMPALVTTSLHAYEACILRLVTDAAERQALRQHLLNGPALRLFDSARFTRHLEVAYDAMMAQAQRGACTALRVLPGATGYEELI